MRWLAAGGFVAFTSSSRTGDGRGLAVTGNGGRGGSQTYLGPRARRAVPGDMMMYCCDVRSHVVSESVEGGWLMPGT